MQKDIEEYGVLKITKKGEDFLKKPTSFKIVLNNLFEEANADDEEGSSEAACRLQQQMKSLFEMLKELRQKEAKKKEPSSFCYFPGNFVAGYGNPVSNHYCGTGKMPGCKQRKGIRYGKPFVELIAKYVEENNIEKPDDFVMKSVVNKSGNKVYIIQQVDKKIPLETIAKNKDLRLDACWKKWKPLLPAEPS